MNVRSRKKKNKEAKMSKESILKILAKMTIAELKQLAEAHENDPNWDIYEHFAKELKEWNASH